MRRPVGVKWVLLFFRWTRFFLAAESPLSPPFHPHSSVSDFRSVQVRCSRFSRCCHLIVDLSSVSKMEVGQAIDAVTETRLWAFAFPSLEDFDFMRPPASLPGDCCATVRTLLHSPTADAATPPAFTPWQSPLVSSHSFHRALPVSSPSVADRCPLQTVP